jgi:hypothetical protein
MTLPIVKEESSIFANSNRVELFVEHCSKENGYGSQLPCNGEHSCNIGSFLLQEYAASKTFYRYNEYFLSMMPM